jgi:WYL domain
MRALAKLEQVLPARLRRRVRAVGSFTVPALTGAPTVDADVLATIAAACRDQERLRFGYRSYDGEPTRRTVEPHRLVHLARRWYLVAWDVGRDDWRSFRVDRITTRLSVGTRFPARKPPPGGAAAFVARGASAARDRWQAKVILHGSVPAAHRSRLARRPGGLHRGDRGRLRGARAAGARRGDPPPRRPLRAGGPALDGLRVPVRYAAGAGSSSFPPRTNTA